MSRPLLVLLVVCMLCACAGRRFEAARAEDTAAAYHRLLREDPDSPYADEARQRLEFVKIRSKPSAEAYDAFVARWPSSELLPELRALVEDALFERARALGTPDAYRAFAADFAGGRHAARALGNLAYLEADGFGGSPDALRGFAAAHPESDFAAEALRSARAPAGRASSAFRRVGLVVEIAAGTPGPERLARVFSERAGEAFAALGVTVVPIAGGMAADAADPPARLRILHGETAVRTQLSEGQVTAPGIEIETRIELEVGGAPAFARRIALRAPAAAPLADTSVLFAPGMQRYWSEFFVPILDWNTRLAVRTPFAVDGPVAAVASDGSRGIVLMRNGSLKLLDLADPERPWSLAEYRRPGGLETFTQLRVIGDRVVSFGPDGVEIVRLAGARPQLVRAFDRGMVGTIVGVEAAGGELLAGGNRGLFALSEAGEPELRVAKHIVGMGRVGGFLVFSDGRKVYVASPAQLAQARIESELDLGPTARLTGVRASGSQALLLGERSLWQMDLSRPAAPSLVGRVDITAVGEIRDATLVDGRLFALGLRGLLELDARGSRVASSTDVAARTALGVMGRHLVMVGEPGIQVVDLTPFLAQGLAAPPPSAPAPAGR